MQREPGRCAVLLGSGECGKMGRGGNIRSHSHCWPTGRPSICAGTFPSPCSWTQVGDCEDSVGNGALRVFSRMERNIKTGPGRRFAQISFRGGRRGCWVRPTVVLAFGAAAHTAALRGPPSVAGPPRMGTCLHFGLFGVSFLFYIENNQTYL